MMGLKADLEGQSNEFKSGDRVVSTNLPKKTQSKLFIHRFEKVGLRVGSDLDKNLIGQQDPRSDIYPKFSTSHLSISHHPSSYLSYIKAIINSIHGLVLSW